MNVQTPITPDARPGTVPRIPDADRSLVVADADHAFAARLARGLEALGYAVTTVGTAKEALATVAAAAPAYLVVDLRIGEDSGLDVLSLLKARRPEARTVILTGYGSIASAVTATKLGAFDYLSKPSGAEEVDAALRSEPGMPPAIPETYMTADRVRWEHIQRVHEICGGNVSETARRLHMHRRTLQRILAKRAPR